jgi:hypothetical protein
MDGCSAKVPLLLRQFNNVTRLADGDVLVTQPPPPLTSGGKTEQILAGIATSDCPILTKRSTGEQSRRESLICGFSLFVHAIHGGGYQQNTPDSARSVLGPQNLPRQIRSSVNHLCQNGISPKNALNRRGWTAPGHALGPIMPEPESSA